MHVSLINILGYTIKILSSDKNIINAIHQIYPSDVSQKKAIIVFTLHKINKSLRPLSLPARFNVDALKLQGQSGNSYFIADRQNMQGQAWLCQHMLAQPYLLRHQVINSVIYFLLSYRDLSPLHCCAFRLNNLTLLCLGESGAGKSTLAMQAYQQGAQILAEDIVFLDFDQKKLIVRGDCREIHLLSDANNMFPLLNEQPIRSSHNGKEKYIVPIFSTRTMISSENMAVVFIQAQHNNSLSSLRANTTNEHHQRLILPEEEGFSLLCHARKKHLEALLEKPSYILEAGRNIEQTFQVLGELCR